MAVIDLDIAPRAKQTYDALRLRVDALACGVPLPSVAEIRAELGVGQATVEKALALLEQQGLVERKRRKGIFVADRSVTGEIAIVLSQIHLGPNASPTYAQLCSLLRQELHEVNPNWAVKLHLGVSSVPGPDFPATLDLLEPTVLPRLRGVLSLVPLHRVQQQLNAAGVPVICLSSGRIQLHDGVFLDHDQLLRAGILHLAEAGCRSVVLLHMRYVGTKPQCPDRTPLAAAAAAECGVKFRDKWAAYEEGGWGDQCGYELFMRLWNQPERPDGVLVSDEILCHGVLRAIRELKLKLPRELRLVTQATSGTHFSYSHSVTRLQYDLKVCAIKARRMLETLIDGQVLETHTEQVQAVLIKGETT